MKKFLILAVFLPAMSTSLAFADTGTSTIATSTPPTATSTQITCIQNALDKRENALIAAVGVFNTSQISALTNRLSGLKTAWASLDKKTRIEKRLSVYKAFRTEMQAANTVLKNAKNSAWKVFESDAKTCGIKGTGEAPAIISSSNITL